MNRHYARLFYTLFAYCLTDFFLALLKHPTLGLGLMLLLVFSELLYALPLLWEGRGRLGRFLPLLSALVPGVFFLRQLNLGSVNIYGLLLWGLLLLQRLSLREDNYRSFLPRFKGLSVLGVVIALLFSIAFSQVYPGSVIGEKIDVAGGLSAFAGPYILFLAAGVLGLRSYRGKDFAPSNPAYERRALLELGAFVAAVGLGAVLQLPGHILSVLRLVWRGLLSPLLLFILSLFKNGVKDAWRNMDTQGFLEARDEAYETRGQGAGSGTVANMAPIAPLNQEAAAQMETRFYYLPVIVLGLAALSVLLFILLRDRGIFSGKQGSSAHREPIPPEELWKYEREATLKKWGRAYRIRQYYRQLLSKQKKQGLQIAPADTAMSLQREFEGAVPEVSEEGRALWRLYTAARYGQGESEPRDVKKAKALCAAMDKKLRRR